MLRWILAPNPSPMTLDGTRTYVVGRRRVAVIDPGPRDAAHLDAIADEVGGSPAEVLLTHDHPDHAEGAAELAVRLGAPLLGMAAGTCAAGTVIPTDAGELRAIATPGHTADHLSFHWPATRAVFCGDLMMGGQDTALVADPEGRLGDYLASLARLGELAPAVLYPAHGPPFHEPVAAIERYVRHRAERERQVLAAHEEGARTVTDFVAAVYGPSLQPALRGAAAAAVRAYLRHLSERDGLTFRI
jgi:glyoxylase-like metal-dependent hydrolase (beta-lactamase superfamily II)